ncbi:hypothetical protein ACHAPI_011968 [Fusarium lateritium]
MAEPDDPVVTNPMEPEDQPAEDSGVDEAIGNASSTQSISSSILQYRVENGRRYTTYGSGEYLLPNDEDEQVRLGTGIWSIDVGVYSPRGGVCELLIMGSADEHEEAEVLGVDLSPIQPNWFEVDDLEKEWTFKRQFDFIFIRSMIASFKDWPGILSQAFENLEPGGYIEVQDNVYPLASDDGTIHDTDILRWSKLMADAANAIGRSITVAPDFKPMLEGAGFVDIVEIKKKIPMNIWPKDPRYKELGRWSCSMLLCGIEGISMRLLTGLGLTVDEVRVLLAKVRKDLLSTKIHGYWYTYDRPLPR